MADDADEANAYLSSMVNRTLHLHTSDGRMFVGQMKCTDSERNIILAMTHEYRQPSEADIKRATQRHEQSGSGDNVKVDMKKRFVGLKPDEQLSVNIAKLSSSITDTASDMADPLYVLAKARIACSNAIQELEALNSMTDDWDYTEKDAASAALDIQLQCEFAAKESTAIHEILTSFATSNSAPNYLIAEVKVRQENAVAAAKEVRKVITEMAALFNSLRMELLEMGRRIDFILPKFQNLGGLFDILPSHSTNAVAKQDTQRDHT
ncbi:N-alpha-acetyltransferase 38-A, NatC auxiliary subunit [Pseudocercospora fuligena]|uniref:N-alpha-acetyltransferase 38-A, NatC auxiliary subunit n=1 Tax=Pseudocercospora fuligena TaxID=685502 RepID=A0A8H6VHY4_9PEZI|nr:N-alpha-acetyltransferase 38-A, NatC auxiliary subunit [Pseudocercospora fuligena]